MSKIQDIIHELRTYNPQADEYQGRYVHKGWADRLEAATIASAPTAEPVAFREAVGGLVYVAHALVQNPKSKAQRREVERYADRVAEMLVAMPTAPAAESVNEGEHRFALRKAKGYAPGDYMSKCFRCDAMFTGDKQAHTCQRCADQAIDADRAAHSSLSQVDQEASGQIEYLDRELHRKRMAVAKLMARLTIWLDEDQFNEADEIMNPEFEPGALGWLEDSARLDWIEQQGEEFRCFVNTFGRQKNKISVWGSGDETTGVGETMREAIDEARVSQSTPSNPPR